MSCYIELGHSAAGGFPAIGPEPMELKSGAFPVKLEGSHDAMVVSSDEPGWLHVSRTRDEKAAIGRSRRITPSGIRPLSGVGGGMYVSFIADESREMFKPHDEPVAEEAAVSAAPASAPEDVQPTAPVAVKSTRRAKRAR